MPSTDPWLGDIDLALAAQAARDLARMEPPPPELTYEQKEQRWLRCVGGLGEQLARQDAHLMALLRVWVCRRELTLKWVAVEYLKRWPDLARLLAEAELPVGGYAAMWPKWEESPGAAIDAHADCIQAWHILPMACEIAQSVCNAYANWLKLRPPPPIIVTREQAAEFAPFARPRI